MNSSDIKVLYIEDDVALANLFKKRLKKDGFVVDLDFRGDEIVSEIESNHYNIIFLDNDLPGGSGLDILFQIREAGIDIPVIIVTGQGNEQLAVLSLKSGASDYIVKDVNMQYMENLPFIIKKEVESYELKNENKKIQSALKKSERSLKKAQQIAKLGNWVFNPTTKELFWSDELYRIYDTTKEETTPSEESFYAHVHPDDVEFIQNEFERHLTTKNKFEIIHRYLNHDGSIKYLKQMCDTEFDEDDKPIISYGTVQDITKEKIAEEKLKQLNNTMQIMIDSMPFSVFIVDQNRKIRTINDYAVELLGFNNKDEILGKTCHDIICSADINMCPIYDLGETVNKTEREIITKNGNKIPILKSVVQITIDDEEMLLESFIDISHLKKTEEELIKAKEKAEEANKAKSQFLSSMSHEIRTPLNPIIGITEALIEKATDKEQKRLLKVINSSGKSLLELINDILDISKIEAGQMHIEEIPFDIIETIENVCDICLLKAKDRNLDIVTQISRGITRKLIGDPLRIKQILLNLLSNAIKFSSDGIITVACKEIMANDVMVKLELFVEDCGIGIPKDKLESIFEDFTQADSSTTRKYGGTGLGLGITKKLVQMMNGSITLESEVGKGSKFIISLGLKKVSKNLKENTRYNRRASDRIIEDKKFNPNLDKSIKPKKLLLVDDSFNNRLVVNVFLKDYPIEIDEAENGQIALDKIKNKNYDLILMDIEMPVLDGYSTIKEIRQYEKENNITNNNVIAMTAYAFSSDSELCRTYGFTDYLSKPISKEMFYLTLGKYIPDIFSNKTATHKMDKTEDIELDVDPILLPYLPKFINSLEEQIENLKSFIEEGDMDNIKKAIHTIKGNSGSYGLMYITNICKEIEDQIIKDADYNILDKINLIDTYLISIKKVL